MNEPNLTPKIKLIWDFRGKDAEQTALHHTKHLNEFARIKNIDPYSTGVEEISPNHFIAFIIVEQQHKIMLRDTLKPHRGEYVD